MYHLVGEILSKKKKKKKIRNIIVFMFAFIKN